MKKRPKCDFSGWATRNNLKCADGRTIIKDAFKECDGTTVPLVWNHQHNDPSCVLGHALLENRDEGVYAYGFLNDTETAAIAKALLQHGDIKQMSIYANQLTQDSRMNVMHGIIREVSLVHASANPGAWIDTVIAHSDDHDEEAVIYTGEELELIHSADYYDEKENEEMADQERTIGEIIDDMTDEQQEAVAAIIGSLVEDDEDEYDDDEYDEYDDDEYDDEYDEDYEEEYADMKHNVFDNDYEEGVDFISHSEMQEVIDDAKRFGSLRESALQHGIENIDMLFPEAKNLNNPPDWIKRDTGWVSTVMGSVHHTPFSRIKSSFADITEDDARAKGYIKGKLKKEEVFSLLKRTTGPTTVYKKQKLDRDDVIDITDFDVIAWLKSEMRIMLDEELARAYLIGDGRLNSSDEKIKEDCIRPIAFDEELFTIQAEVEVDQSDASIKYKNFIKQAIRARKDYKGSGNPTLFTTEEILTECLLLEDTIGHTLYSDEAALAKKLRVSKIVTVPVMENRTGKNGGALMGIIVNLSDYNVGADKGGAVNLFDDFDIDYNAQKYLIETRCSGALTKPYSAIALCVKNS